MHMARRFRPWTIHLSGRQGETPSTRTLRIWSGISDRRRHPVSAGGLCIASDGTVEVIELHALHFQHGVFIIDILGLKGWAGFRGGSRIQDTVILKRHDITSGSLCIALHRQYQHRQYQHRHQHKYQHKNQHQCYHKHQRQQQHRHQRAIHFAPD